MLELGAKLPAFSLQNQQDEPVTDASLAGKPVVFFFYPRADTPGCTTEACAFRDLLADFQAAGVTVYGVSGDTVKKQANFTKKYGLTTPLLADPEHTLLSAFGVWQEKTMYGRTSMGIVRSTFLFNKEGKLAQVWPKVKVAGHAEQVLAAAQAL